MMMTTQTPRLPQARHYLYPVHPSHALLASGLALGCGVVQVVEMYW